MSHVNLNRRALKKLKKVKEEHNCSYSEAVMILYEKYLFWLSKRRKGDAEATFYE